MAAKWLAYEGMAGEVLEKSRRRIWVLGGGEGGRNSFGIRIG